MRKDANTTCDKGKNAKRKQTKDSNNKNNPGSSWTLRGEDLRASRE
jgi:hypothetical protein